MKFLLCHVRRDLFYVIRHIHGVTVACEHVGGALRSIGCGVI